MATLSSSSTDAEVEAAYADNASYAEDGSLAKARTFITACRLLLLKRPKSGGKGGPGGATVEFDPTLYERQIAAAEQWIATNNTGAGVRYAQSGATLACAIGDNPASRGFVSFRSSMKLGGPSDRQPR